MNIFNRKNLLALAAIAALALAVVWMAGGFTAKVTPGSARLEPVVHADTVAVVEVVRPLFEPVPASIQAKQATFISSRILAGIEKIAVRAGDTVSKGQLLIELEKTDLQSRASQFGAQANAVKARLTEAKQALVRAMELKRKGLIATADLDKARANHDALVADYAATEQALREAQTAVGFAQIQSPIDGKVIDRFAEPGDTAQPGARLLSIYNPLTLRVEAHVREQLAISLSLEQPLVAEIPSLNKTLNCDIEELVPAADSGSRSFLVKGRLGLEPGLLPGMYARLMVPAGTEKMLLIPADRVARVGQLNVVWVAQQAVSQRRFVRLGKTLEDGSVVVVAGLDAGEKVLPVPTGARRGL